MAGMMVEGKWKTDGNERDQSGEFNPMPTTFRDRVTADGKSRFKAEAGRYHLYVSLACPWAHRTLIMRELKGLNQIISVSIKDLYQRRGFKATCNLDYTKPGATLGLRSDE